MTMVFASTVEMPKGFALCVVVMPSEEVRAAIWSSTDDVPEEAVAYLRSQLELEAEAEVEVSR